MKQVIICALIFFILAILPGWIWALIALASAALFTALGIYAAAMIIKGFVRGLKNGGV
jgi:hypothetical protein